MKAKTMLGLIACASACVSLSAFGNTDADWFSVSASETTATLIHVSTNMGVEVTGGKLIVDTDDTPLLFTPDPLVSETNRSDGVVTIAASAELKPNSVSDLDSVDGAKVGLAVGVNNNVTNYYGYAAEGWKVLTGDAVSVPDSGDTSFKLILDYRTRTAKFYIGQKLMTYGADTPTNAPSFAAGTDTLLDIAAYGSGSISSIDTDFEIAVVDVGGTKYGSVADAEAAGGNASTIKVVDSTGAVVNKTTANNGLSVAVCAALGLSLDDSSANITVKPAATDTNQNRITLALNMPDAPETDAVRFQVSDGGLYSQTCGASQIEIPLEAGTYTIIPVLK